MVDKMKNKIKTIIMIMCIGIMAFGFVGCGDSEDNTTRIMYKVSKISDSLTLSPGTDTIELIKRAPEFKDLKDLGDDGLNTMLNQFETETGLGEKNELIMAVVCADILNEDLNNRTWKTGREWYESYKANK